METIPPASSKQKKEFNNTNYSLTHQLMSASHTAAATSSSRVQGDSKTAMTGSHRSNMSQTASTSTVSAARKKKSGLNPDLYDFPDMDAPRNDSPARRRKVIKQNCIVGFITACIVTASIMGAIAVSNKSFVENTTDAVVKGAKEMLRSSSSSSANKKISASTLLEKAQDIAVIEAPPHANVEVVNHVCSRESVEEDKEDCVNICTPGLCCFTEHVKNNELFIQEESTESCLNAYAEICAGYDACLTLFTSISTFNHPPVPPPGTRLDVQGVSNVAPGQRLDVNSNGHLATPNESVKAASHFTAPGERLDVSKSAPGVRLDVNNNNNNEPTSPGMKLDVNTNNAQPNAPGMRLDVTKEVQQELFEIDQVMETANIHEICSFENVFKTKVGRDECEDICQEASCCLEHENSPENCLDERKDFCLEYKECAILNMVQAADETNELQDSIVNACSESSIFDSESGRDMCRQLCQAGECCFTEEQQLCDESINCDSFRSCFTLREYDEITSMNSTSTRLLTSWLY